MARASAASPSGLGTYPTTMVPINTPSDLRVSSCGHVSACGRAPGTCDTRAAATTALGHCGAVSLIEEPVPRAAQVLLRRLVLDHLTTEHRRVFPSVLHLGRPGRPGPLDMAALTEPAVGGRRSAYDALDDAQRCDVLEAVLRRRPTTPGVADPARRARPAGRRRFLAPARSRR